MESVIADSTAKSLELVSAYAGQLSRVFHRCQTILLIDSSEAVQDHVNIINSILRTLNEIQSLLQGKNVTNPNRMLSEEGSRYVNVLNLECFSILQKIAPTVAKAGVKRERKKKGKNGKKTKVAIIEPVVPTQSKLDEERLMNDLENVIWYRVLDDVDAYIERLKEVQLHLLLVYQVVTVGSLSRDLSSGKVDIHRIVTYHEGINRTADLIRFSPGSHRGFRSSSSSVYTISDSDNDSDVSSLISRRSRNSRPSFVSYPPPPPPPSQPFGVRGPPAPSPPPPSPGVANDGRPLILTLSPSPKFGDSTTPNVNPPSYDSHKTLCTPPLKQTLPSPSIPATPKIFSNEKSQVSEASPLTKVVKEQTVKKPMEPRVPEGQLFSSPPNRFSFRIKTLFRSKDSLANEMTKVLRNTSSVLEAFLIQGTDLRPIPHSALHSLEATHMRTILGQLNGKTWFETFSKLTRIEHDTLNNAVLPGGPPQRRREVLALEILQENKSNAWMRLLAARLRTAFLPQHSNGRVILAILRKHVSNHGLMPNLDLVYQLHLGPPPPHLPVPNAGGPLPVGASQPARLPNIRIPPSTAPEFPGGSRFVSLDPPVLNIVGSTNIPRGGSYLPPTSLRMAPPPLPPAPTFSTGEHTICNDFEASIALTTYNEFTLRIPADSPGSCRDWSSITITQEYNALPEITTRVNEFLLRRNTIIDVKLRLTEQQSAHMDRLIEDIRSRDRDYRFEWCWVEISLYDNIGQIAVCSLGNSARAATNMHLIARRTLKREHKATEVYRSLMTGRSYTPMPLPFMHTGNLTPPRSGPPPPPPGGRPPPPPCAPPPVFIERSTSNQRLNWRRKSRRMNDSSSVSDTISDSDSDHYSRRGRVMRRRRNSGSTRRRYSDGKSSDDSDDEEDVIKIPIVLKRGDDVVQKLLDLWTPDVGSVGKSGNK